MQINEISDLVEKYRNVKFEKVFNFTDMFQSYEKYVNNISGRKIKLGMNTLDNALGLIRPSQLCTIIGATNVGKTTLAMHICYHNSIAMRDKLILMFNLEIDENEILERTLQTEFDLTTYEVENAFLNNDKILLDKFVNVKTKYENFISIVGRVDIHDIIPYAKAVEEKYEKELGLIIIDYLGLLKNKNFRDEYSRTSDNIQKLKETALHLQIPVIDISQTSRADVKNTDNGLNLYSAKSSGEVENSSQIVITIDRLNKDKAFSFCDNKTIQEAEDKKIYILKASIQKKKQGNFADCILIQERRNLRIFDYEKYSQVF